MPTATLVLSPIPTVSKPDTRDWTRAIWRAAYGMARRMVRDRATHGTGEALTWFFDAGFRRFGYAALPIVRAAGWVAFNRLHVSKAATGTAEELAHQGMLTRCVRLEPAPRGGWSWAWTFDELGSPNTARSLRRYRAQRRREVARIMAQDRAAMEQSSFALTVTGLLALRAAEAATA